MSIFVEGIYNKEEYLTPEELAEIKKTMDTFFESWKNGYTDDMLDALDTTPYEVPVSNPSINLIMYIRNILANDKDSGQTKYKLLSFELYDKVTTIIKALYHEYPEDISTKIINYINDQNNNFKRKFCSKDKCPDEHLDPPLPCSDPPLPNCFELYELIIFLFFVRFILESHNKSKYGPGSEIAKEVEVKFNERNSWFEPEVVKNLNDSFGGRKLKRSKRSKRSKRQKRSKKNRKSKNKSRR
jgi:hypothetical protein